MSAAPPRAPEGADLEDHAIDRASRTDAHADDRRVGPRDSVAALHAEVDVEAARLQALHGARLRCARGCTGCCADDLTVSAPEAAHIRAQHARLLAEARPHAPGACAFLDGEGACRIYAARPYVCRTQGLPLRWIDEDAEGEEAVEYRDICPLNEAGTPLEALTPDACWTLGPAEERLATLGLRGPAGERGAEEPGARVALRALFARG